MTIDEYIEFVNAQTSFHERQSARFSNDNLRKQRHSDIAKQFESLSAFLKTTKETPPKPTSPLKPTFGQLRLGNLEDLPESIRSQIKISDSEQLEMDIIQVIEDLDGVAAIDEIMVGLWRSLGKETERDFLSRKIYRMVQSGTAFSASKKGYYQLTKPDDDEETNDIDNEAEDILG